MIIGRIVGVCRVFKKKYKKNGIPTRSVALFLFVICQKISLPSSTALRVKGATEKKGRDLLRA